MNTALCVLNNHSTITGMHKVNKPFLLTFITQSHQANSIRALANMQITDNWEIIKNKKHALEFSNHSLHLYRSCINILDYIKNTYLHRDLKIFPVHLENNTALLFSGPMLCPRLAGISLGRRQRDFLGSWGQGEEAHSP